MYTVYCTLHTEFFSRRIEKKQKYLTLLKCNLQQEICKKRRDLPHF